MLLVFAKFVPGINTMAPPLAGSMNMRWTQFAALDAAGATLYVGAYFSTGYLFTDAVGAIMAGLTGRGCFPGGIPGPRSRRGTLVS